MLLQTVEHNYKNYQNTRIPEYRYPVSYIPSLDNITWLNSACILYHVKKEAKLKMFHLKKMVAAWLSLAAKLLMVVSEP